MNPTMTPKGVEHKAAAGVGDRNTKVNPTMTPKGVEHIDWPPETVALAYVNPTMTPKGVEHYVRAALMFLLPPREPDDDAERR